MYISKVTFFCEMFILRQIGLPSVFHDAKTVFLQKLVLKHQSDDFPVKIHIVGRIGKNKIVLLVAFSQEITHIGLENIHFSFQFMLFHHLLNKAHAIVVGIDTGNVAGIPRSKLQGNIACSGAQVQDFKILQAELVLQDIEQAFLRKIRRRAGRKVFGH